MQLRKYRWSKQYDSTEEELLELLKAKNIQAERWVAEGDEVFAPHSHAKDKQLWCVEGSMVFTANGKRISLQAGDAMDLPANTVHEAIAGFADGCICYEFPRTADNPVLPVTESQ